MPSSRALAMTLLALTSSTLAQAPGRPSEEDLFGEPAPAAPREDETLAPAKRPDAPGEPGQPPAAREPPPESREEDRLLGSLFRTEDPLRIGGLLYLRADVSARKDTPPSRWDLSAPSVTDLYLDARPLERVRGFVLGRMFFDPTLTNATNLLGTTANESDPRVLLDQLWLAFDIGRTAFVTLGRQHVKWGVGRFWNPTDYLHAVRRDPLATFDQRPGTYMARVQLPWERMGWNLTLAAVFEPLVTQATSAYVTSVPTTTAEGAATTTPQGQASNQLGGVGGGARAEIALGTWQLGADAVVQRGIRPRFGFDLTGGLWVIDFRGELSLRTSSDVALYRGTAASFQTYEPEGIRPSAVGGAEWTHKYSDDDTFTFGVEYFYNSNGYFRGDRGLYPVLLVNNAFTPFYLGRHYAAAYLSLPKPGSWDRHTFTLTGIANLSDRSELVRLDWSVTFLTYLTMELYLQGHLGTDGGEFRLSLDVPSQNINGTVIPAIVVAAPLVDAGITLRISL
jgi:hypothetical protein